MSRNPFDISVIGAGVVGGAAALALAKDGFRVALVEAHEPRPWRAEEPDLRVYAFAPDNSAFLDDLGVWSSVATARAQPYRQMRVWDAAGGGELHFSAEQIGREALGHIVEHGLLVDRLWQAIAREPGIVRYCPDKLAQIEQDGKSATATLASGARLRSALILGADGAASKVREAVGLATNAHDYGQRGLVAYVRTGLSHQETAWQRFLTTGPLAFLPCNDGRSSIVWTLPDAEAERLLALDATAFCRELTRAFDARLGEVTEVSQRIAFPLRRQLADEYISGRVALIGDAAHTVHPLAGQGVNLGLRDVVALRAILRDGVSANRGIAAPHRLERWARARRSENAIAAYSFEAINRLFSNDALLPTLLRGHALGLVGHIAPLGQFLLRRAAGI
jgi:2-octaprenyl-3-methyl-6-methoxy-1,4-benzoquinol hydroxylase